MNCCHNHILISISVINSKEDSNQNNIFERDIIAFSDNMELFVYNIEQNSMLSSFESDNMSLEYINQDVMELN